MATCLFVSLRRPIRQNSPIFDRAKYPSPRKVPANIATIAPFMQSRLLHTGYSIKLARVSSSVNIQAHLTCKLDARDNIQAQHETKSKSTDKIPSVSLASCVGRCESIGQVERKFTRVSSANEAVRMADSQASKSNWSIGARMRPCDSSLWPHAKPIRSAHSGSLAINPAAHLAQVAASLGRASSPFCQLLSGTACAAETRHIACK